MKKILTLCMMLTIVATAAWAANATKKEVNLSNLQPTQSGSGDAQMDAVKAAQMKFEAGQTLSAAEKATLEAYWNAKEARYEGNGLDATGGPDAFGYTWIDNANNPGDAPYEWEELCGDPGASDGPSGDDAAILAPLGFNFTYYGVVYNGVYISTNGTMRFGATFNLWTNACINTTNTNEMICPYWDDMITSGAGNGCAGDGSLPFIRFKSDNVGHFWVQYQKMDPFSGTGVTTFQVHLRADGTIKVVFSDDPTEYTHTSASATVGLESAGANGLQYLCNVTGIVPGRVVLFNPPSQDPTGRCCYGDPCTGFTCLEGYTLDECAAIGGSWIAGASCTSAPCPGPAQPGDLCCNAFPVSGLPFSAAGTTCGYTNNYDEACPYTGSTSPDVVYTYTPTVDQQVTFSLCLSGYDTKLYIYDGAPTPGGAIACNDDASPCPGSTGSYRSLLECVQLYAGHSYCIVVDGYGGACGDYVLTMDECIPVPPCDVVCPVGARLEGEPTCFDGYDDVYNSGCNDLSGNNSTTPIACGDVVCGTYGTYLSPTGGQSRDTDWYLLSVTDAADSVFICVTGEAVAGTQLAILPVSPCDQLTVVYNVVSLACEPQCFSACLPAGDYWVFVSANAFDGVPCGSEYVLSVSCLPCAEPFVCHCGEAPNSHCTFATDNTEFPINDGIPTTFVTINVPIEYQITDLNVCLDIVHTYDADLVITLTSPMGTIIDLSSNNGGSGDNYTCTTFDDEAANSVIGGSAPFSDSYIPESPLSAVDGQNAVGAWVLAITDQFGGDEGWLNYVCLTFEYDEILPVAFGSFDAVAGNGLVTLNWNTESETNVDHFEVSRNGSVVANVEAMNSATGANYSYVDNGLSNGTTYSYSLVAVDVNGARQALATLSATPNASAVITEYALHQNYPNPFNPTTTIAFDMVEAGKVSISVFNIMGQKVAEIVNGSMEAGRHVVTFDATGLSSGLYLYKMEANGFTAQSKMVLMK